MSPRIKRTMRFEQTASMPKHALAAVYDLEGFSRFFSQPDVQDYVPRFLNHVSDAVTVTFAGGHSYWLDPPQDATPLLAPVHQKFLGDGMLLVWTPERGQNSFSEGFLRALCNRLWNLKFMFHRVVEKAADDVPVAEVPRSIRVGLARGTVFQLSRQNSRQKEFIGYAINLASRLQSYCPGIGLMASARLQLPQKLLDKHGYRRVVATQLEGFPKEIVIVDADEYDSLDEGTRDRLFEPI